MDQQGAIRESANRALFSDSPRSTFALQMLRDQTRRLELAERMRRLREDSPYTQQAIADALELKLRSYQKAEQTGGISYERLQRLANLHHVDFHWLLRGDAPDVLGALDNGMVSRLERIEAKLDDLSARVGELQERASAEAVKAAASAAGRASRGTRAGRSRKPPAKEK